MTYLEGHVEYVVELIIITLISDEFPFTNLGLELELGVGADKLVLVSRTSPPLSFSSFPSFTDFLAANSFSTSVLVAGEQQQDS